MSRPATLTAAAVVHALSSVIILAGSGFVFIVLVRATARAGHTAYGLIFGGMFLLIIGVIYCFATLGLWRARRWGWWLALVMNVVVELFMIWNIFIDGDRDPDNWWIVGMFALMTVFLLLPGARPRTLAAAEVESATSGTAV